MDISDSRSQLLDVIARAVSARLPDGLPKTNLDEIKASFAPSGLDVKGKSVEFALTLHRMVAEEAFGFETFSFGQSSAPSLLGELTTEKLVEGLVRSVGVSAAIERARIEVYNVDPEAPESRSPIRSKLFAWSLSNTSDVAFSKRLMSLIGQREEQPVAGRVSVRDAIETIGIKEPLAGLLRALETLVPESSHSIVKALNDGYDDGLKMVCYSGPRATSMSGREARDVEPLQVDGGHLSRADSAVIQAFEKLFPKDKVTESELRLAATLEEVCSDFRTTEIRDAAVEVITSHLGAPDLADVKVYVESCSPRRGAMTRKAGIAPPSAERIELERGARASLALTAIEVSARMGVSVDQILAPPKEQSTAPVAMVDRHTGSVIPMDGYVVATGSEEVAAARSKGEASRQLRDAAAQAGLVPAADLSALMAARDLAHEAGR